MFREHRLAIIFAFLALVPTNTANVKVKMQIATDIYVDDVYSATHL